MNLSIIKKIALAFFAFAFLSSCTEQYIYQNQDFEDAMSVEATLTNELKFNIVSYCRNWNRKDGCFISLDLFVFSNKINIVRVISAKNIVN